MGILDDLLGGLAGQAVGGRAPQQQTRTAGGGAGMSQVLMALMPVVLQLLSGRGAGGGSGTGGGIADVLGQVLGRIPVSMGRVRLDSPAVVLR